MRAFAIIAALALAPGTVYAADQDTNQAALTKSFTTYMKLPSGQWTTWVRPMLQNVYYYNTAAELTAASLSDGRIAYAIDTDTFYYRISGTWIAGLGANTITLGNGGTFDNATNGAFEWNETSEDMLATATANLWTWSSNTGATFAFTPAVGFTGIATFSGGVGAITLTDSASSFVLPDNDATAAIFGSTGRLNLLTLDTVDNTETVVVTGTTATQAFHVDVGEAIFDEGVDMAVPAAVLDVVRFCGNGSATGAAHYMGPVLASDIIDATGGAQDPVDITFGSAFCDGLDNATEATADRVWHTSWAIKPVAMSCVGRCTGASAANDPITYQLRDDTASVTGMTCTAAAWSGDDTPAQCTVRDASPATIAANSAIAVLFTGTDDACGDAGDDFECYVYFTR